MSDIPNFLKNTVVSATPNFDVTFDQLHILTDILNGYSDQFQAINAIHDQQNWSFWQLLKYCKTDCFSSADQFSDFLDAVADTVKTNKYFKNIQ